ncbi:MAG: nucleotidyltransferase [Bacteroidetes bacterium]|nr:nucleotidyltransferase [Bacteroidota bacterium]
MQQPTLLILAAGMASRYGSMKQTEGFGPSGETIMDYSIYDAIKAGFGKIVFVIRKDFAENFKASFDAKLKGRVEVEYVYQEKDYFVDPQYMPEDRTKPWGTGHAVLCASDVIKEPFAVINADDFYGYDGFAKAVNFLTNDCNEKTYSIIGYILKSTLSDNGTVSRGVCDTDASNNLVDINERTKIYRNKEGIVVYENNDGELVQVSEDSSVSMNFWCFHPTVFDVIKKLFKDFPKDNFENIKAEFFIPIIGEYFIKKGGGKIKVIPTTAQWFGVTYKEDAPEVKASLDKLINDGTYPTSLWNEKK